MDIQFWIDESGRIAKDNGWDNEEVPFPETLALIHSELSEALEHYRHEAKIDDSWIDELSGKPDGIPVEIADVLIRVFHWLSFNEIDIETYLHLKMEYNADREYRHGGLKA